MIVHHGEHSADTGRFTLCAVFKYHCCGTHADRSHVVHVPGEDRKITVYGAQFDPLHLSVIFKAIHGDDL